MPETVWLDYETRSLLPLDERGLDNYAADKSTTVLLAAYAFGDGSPKLWQPHIAPQIPADLEDALNDCFTTIWSWNATFERAITKYVLGIEKPIQEFRDPMVMSRYLSLPGKLEDAGRVLGLKEDTAKLKDGGRLIDLFCSQESNGGAETLFGISQPCFRDWSTDPAEWELFKKYCKQDVIAERAIAKKLSAFPVPEAECQPTLNSTREPNLSWTRRWLQWLRR
jgi:DNA polymerase